MQSIFDHTIVQCINVKEKRQDKFYCHLVRPVDRAISLVHIPNIKASIKKNTYADRVVPQLGVASQLLYTHTNSESSHTSKKYDYEKTASLINGKGVQDYLITRFGQNRPF